MSLTLVQAWTAARKRLDALLDEVKPKTVFDCIGYGAYSFEIDADQVTIALGQEPSQIELPVSRVNPLEQPPY